MVVLLEVLALLSLWCCSLPSAPRAIGPQAFAEVRLCPEDGPNRFGQDAAVLEMRDVLLRGFQRGL